MEKVKVERKPQWIRVRLSVNENYRRVDGAVHLWKLHTICESARCPNVGECWGAGTATILILGDVCTRSCGFCAVKTGKPPRIDWDEPWRTAQAIRRMGVRHCVITSVDRDDLKDTGARLWAATVRAVRALNPYTTLETLVPDFKGKEEALWEIAAVAPEVVSHNMETVRRLHPIVRPQAKYERSLRVLELFARAGLRVKSGFMVGLGETTDEVVELLEDLRRVGCQIVTIGQYLRPSKRHLPVVRYVHPDEFAWYREKALELGFEMVESAPLVRSSYHAERHVGKPVNWFLPGREPVRLVLGWRLMRIFVSS